MHACIGGSDLSCQGGSGCRGCDGHKPTSSSAEVQPGIDPPSFVTTQVIWVIMSVLPGHSWLEQG